MSKPKVLMALYFGGKHAKEESRLLGTVENELGIRKLVEEHGYELITTADKEPSPNSGFDENLQYTEINYHYSVFPSLCHQRKNCQNSQIETLYYCWGWIWSLWFRCS